MSALEIIAVIVNVLGVWLTARRIRWCWPVNVVAVLLYAWIFFSVKLYSDMLLQLVFVVLQFYGWWQWSKGGSDHGKVRVERLPPPPLSPAAWPVPWAPSPWAGRCTPTPTPPCPGWTPR